MTTEDFITELFCRIDDAMRGVAKHSQANLYPSEIVTLGILFALKGVGNRAFYRWLKRDYGICFLSCLTGLVCFDCSRPIRTGPTAFWLTRRFSAWRIPTGLNCSTPCAKGVVRTRLARKASRIIVGLWAANLAFVLNHLGLIVDWDCDTANVYDATFQPSIAQFVDEMVVLTDIGFHSKHGDPTNMKVCPRGTWNVRMIVEGVLSMLTTVCHFKKVGHRVWEYFQGAIGVHDGAVQHLGAVAWLTTR